MARIASIGAFVSVLAGALIGASSTMAASPAPPPEPIPPNAFKLDGTNGYSIAVVAVPAFGSRYPAAVSVTAARGKDSVTYTVVAKVTEDSIRADLGKLGHVDLRLHRSGIDEPLGIRCLRQAATYEAGVWEGSFEFDGERGYTRASATSVAALPGLAVTVDREVLCHGGSSGESRGPNLPGARLAGVSYAGGRTLRFQINKNRPGGKAVFAASLAERHDGVRIYRQAEGFGPAASFRYAEDLRTATLAPPAPFSGTAQISHDPDSVSPSIGGSLRLAFPGRRVKLTGPAVHVSFNHARLTKGQGGSISIGY